jgi:hypothetical protein
MKKHGMLECPVGHRCEYEVSLITRGKPPQSEGTVSAKVESWNFAVVGCDSHDDPKYLGFVQTREEADNFQKEMEKLGWRRVAVFDAAVQTKAKRIEANPSASTTL